MLSQAQIPSQQDTEDTFTSASVPNGHFPVNRVCRTCRLSTLATSESQISVHDVECSFLHQVAHVHT